MARSIILFGYGFAGHIHRSIWEELGFEVVVIDLDWQKVARARKDGLQAFPELTDAHEALDPPFCYDICVDTKEHHRVMKEILDRDGDANILVEKPLVNSDLGSEEVMDLVGRYTGSHIFVNENYHFSPTVKSLTGMMGKFAGGPVAIEANFSKDRMDDIAAGRFVDFDLGVFGIEVAHVIAIINALGAGYRPRNLLSAYQWCNDRWNLPSEGVMAYRTENGSLVTIRSSLTNTIDDTIPYTNAPTTPAEKYRVIHIKGGDGFSVVCQFEPIASRPRFEGMITTTMDGVQQSYDERSTIQDSCMRESLEAAMEYFAHGGVNPSPVEEALHIVRLLLEAVEYSMKRGIDW